jgi:hypothetical protein
MPYVNLPPGQRSIGMYDGSRYAAAREGGRVEVDERHVAHINAMDGNGDAGLLNARFREYGTRGKAGRVCPCSARVWNSWSAACPKCGGPTEPEPAQGR